MARCAKGCCTTCSAACMTRMRESARSGDATRYHVDPDQASRVETTTATLFDQVAGALETLEGGREAARWAARLHEIGLDIAHAHYHHHGAYVIANVDLPGFVRLEQQRLASLVTLHRRKLDDPFLDELPNAVRASTFKLVVLLRLGTLLNRSRSPSQLPELTLAVGPDSLEVRFPPEWLDDNPLTEADLEQERQWLGARGFELRTKRRERG